MASKRVTNAKSERFYKSKGKSKNVGFWAVRGTAIARRGGRPGLPASPRGLPAPPFSPAHGPVLASRAQGFRKQLAAHPVVVALIFFIMVFSGALLAALGRWRRAASGGAAACGHPPARLFRCAVTAAGACVPPSRHPQLIGSLQAMSNVKQPQTTAPRIPACNRRCQPPPLHVFHSTLLAGVASFFMMLPGERHRFTYGGLFGDEE